MLILQPCAAMTSQAFLELSIRLAKDLTDWSQEATKRDVITADHISVLQKTAEIVDIVTIAVVDPARQSSD